VTVKLFAQGYGLKGFCNYFACQLSWFIVMNDFGFTPFQLLYSNGLNIYLHNDQDIYNPTSLFYGNSKLANTDFKNCNEYKDNTVLIDWLYSRQSTTDLRMSAFKCENKPNNGGITISPYFDYGECRLQQISPFSNRPVCFSTEAVKYAQSSYFYTNFIGQLFNNIVTKTRRESVFTQGMHNLNMYFGMTTEIIIGFCLAFITPINLVFGSRDNVFMHFGIVAVPFSLLLLVI